MVLTHVTEGATSPRTAISLLYNRSQQQLVNNNWEEIITLTMVVITVRSETSTTRNKSWYLVSRNDEKLLQVEFLPAFCW